MAKRSKSAKATEARLPVDLAQEIATTGDGRDITDPWVGELRQPRDRRLWSRNDWGIYERIRKDDQVKSVMEQRIRAVVSREWSVLPGDDTDPRSVEAAERFEENLQRIGWDRRTEKMLWVSFYGIAAAEIIWAPRDGLIQFDKIKVRHARRFRIDKDDRWRLITRSKPEGEILPDRKFWIVATGATNDDEPYGEGLADWLYWPTLFKRNGIRFWNIFLDKYGSPTAKATYRRGTPKSEIDKIMQALKAISTDSGFAVPDGVAVELLQAARSGTGDYRELARYMDEAIAKIVLSQTMTTQDGSSLSQAKVHSDVKLEVVRADADLLCDSFNEGPARWWTDLNYGPDVAAPIVTRLVDEEEDLKETAETDAALERMGWVRTEESFRDIYGDGFERKPAPQPADPTKLGHNGGPPLDDAGSTPDQPVVDDKKKPVTTSFAALTFAAPQPMPLYVHRKLLNAGDLVAWAKKAGFKSIAAPEDMHVTVTYSRRPVQWFDMGGLFGPATGELIVPPGGPRLVGQLGDEGAVVLHFAAGEIEWRHKEMVEAGASWDYPQFRPHVTFTYDGGDVDLAALEPYQGKLVFGPEIFERLDGDWEPKEISFAEQALTDRLARLRAAPAGEPDIVTGVVDQLIADDGYAPFAPIMEPIADAIMRSGSADELDEQLIATLAQGDVDKLVDAIARAGFAVRIAGEAGADDLSTEEK